MKKVILLSVLMVAGNCGLFAQYASLTARQEAEIQKVAKLKLDEFNNFMNKLCGPDDDERKEIIPSFYAGGSGSTFLNKQTPIESDFSYRYGEALDVSDYADNFNQGFPADKGTTVTFSIDNISPIQQVGSQKPFLRIFYHESFNGKEVKNDKYQSAARVVEMNITKTANSWETQIIGVAFYKSDKVYDNSHSIPIVESGSEIVVKTNSKVNNDAYNNNLLSKGDAAAVAGNYAEAYGYYKEAGESPRTKAESGKRINELRSKMGNTNHQEVWYTGLKDKADALNQKHKYEAARKYYYYASQNTTESDKITKLISELDTKIAIQQGLEDLYNKQVYDKAVQGYKSAIDNDPNNSDLYAGLARCYGKMFGNEKEVTSNFKKAIDLDPTNPNAYLWQGDYYYDTKDYNRAYVSYGLYANNIDDKSDPVYGLMTFCKGVQAFNKKNYEEAIDSFSVSIKQNPKHAPSYSYLGRCYGSLSKVDQAKEYFEKAIEIDSKDADAHFWHGKFLANYHPKNTDDFTDEAIEEMKTALGYEPYIGEWNLDLGMLYQRKGEDYYSQAMKCYKICIDNDQKTRTQALRKRAQCLTYFAKYDEALADLDNIKTKIGTDYRDMGVIYVKLEKCEKAKECFENSKLDDAVVRFGKAEAEFLCEPNGQKYLDLFASAFNKGIPERMLENDPIIRKLEQNAEFRKLRKKKAL